MAYIKSSILSQAGTKVIQDEPGKGKTKDGKYIFSILDVWKAFDISYFTFSHHNCFRMEAPR